MRTLILGRSTICHDAKLHSVWHRRINCGQVLGYKSPQNALANHFDILNHCRVLLQNLSFHESQNILNFDWDLGFAQANPREERYPPACQFFVKTAWWHGAPSSMNSNHGWGCLWMNATSWDLPMVLRYLGALQEKSFLFRLLKIRPSSWSLPNAWPYWWGIRAASLPPAIAWHISFHDCQTTLSRFHF